MQPEKLLAASKTAAFMSVTAAAFRSQVGSSWLAARAFNVVEHGNGRAPCLVMPKVGRLTERRRGRTATTDDRVVDLRGAKPHPPDGARNCTPVSLRLALFGMGVVVFASSFYICKSVGMS